MASVTVGFVNTEGCIVQLDDAVAIAQCVTSEKIDMLTGFVGYVKGVGKFVSSLAIRTCVISNSPVYQATMWRGRQWMHTSFYLFYGLYRNITAPEEVPEVLDTLYLGPDIWNTRMDASCIPVWERNGNGNVFLQTRVHIKMKKPD